MQGHLNVLGALWITGDRPSESVDPHTGEGHGRGQACRAGVQSGAGQQDGAPLLQSGLALEQLNGPGRPKERKDEEMKTWWLKYSVSLGVG